MLMFMDLPPEIGRLNSPLFAALKLSFEILFSYKFDQNCYFFLEDNSSEKELKNFHHIFRKLIFPFCYSNTITAGFVTHFSLNISIIEDI